MKDPRIEKLADNIINYSVELGEGENVLIECEEAAIDLAKALVEKAYAAGGNPIVSIKDPVIKRVIMTGGSKEHFKRIASYEVKRMKEMQAYVGIRAADNTAELSGVPGDKMQMYQELVSKPVHSEIRVKNTKWAVLRYPNNSMAQMAGMSKEAFEDFYFSVCNLDYKKMSKAMDALVAVYGQTDKVRITGKDTDLSFSIKGIPAVKCDGQRNIPDGEVYTAPVRNSVNGYITYNVTGEHYGLTFERIRLDFKDGRIISATSATNGDKLDEIFNIDEGARYVGEFSIGMNPFIEKPMGDTLFDEKIKDSIHFTPGSSYTEAYNGNKSALHWDLVLIQRPEYGGGDIFFDDRLIRHDGVFVIPELLCLNPENLK